MMNELILHGEAMIFKSTLPDNIKQIQPTNVGLGFHIIADSETTGNHHVVDVNESTSFFTNDDASVTYMSNTKPTVVRCLLADRHTDVTLPAGTWEFGIQKEYDHFEQHLKNVRD
jgi:hypothetical protein